MDCGISTIVKLHETIFFVFNNSPKDNVGMFPCAYTFPGSTHVFRLANLWLISESIWSWEPIKAQSEMPFYCFTWVLWWWWLMIVIVWDWIMCALNVMHTHFIPVHCLCSNFVLGAYSYSLLFFPCSCQIYIWIVVYRFSILERWRVFGLYIPKKMNNR